MNSSQKAFEEAQLYIPGGVNSPVRAFKSVEMNPLFIDKAFKSKITDINGNSYIDYVLSWGPLILGHADKEVVEFIKDKLSLGLSFGAPTLIETELAKLICKKISSIEKLRFVSSGTEATMSALRLARGFTGRKKVIKFNGCYHGHFDSFLVKAGSGALTHGQPDSLGVLQEITQHTISLPYNNIETLKEVFKKQGSEIACVILEPVCGNMGVIAPSKEFRQSLVKLCKENDSLLIFDEVMTGFRVSPGGAQELYNITPDITCLGKVIGGGMPVGAYGGKKEIFEYLSPTGGVYQAGTLSGNPISMACGLATLKKYYRDNCFEAAAQKAQQLSTGLKVILKKLNLKFQAHQIGTMFSLFFTEKEVTNLETAQTSNLKLFKHFFSLMLSEGIYMAPSQFEAGFTSAVHSENDIEDTLKAFEKCLKKICS